MGEYSGFGRRVDSFLSSPRRLIVSAIFMAFVLVSGLNGATPDSTCEGGALHSDSKASGHSLQWTNALISKPAPFWEGTAVIKGSMKEIKLTDYRGKYLVFFFLPLGLYFCVPNRNLGF